MRQEKADIDHQKRVLSMGLQDIPPSIKYKEITQEILSHREKWKAVSDKIYFVREYGFLPEQAAEQSVEVNPDEFGKQLPNDRFVLDKMIKNLTVNVNHKWPDRLATAKTEVKKSEFRLRIAKGEAQLEVMRNKFIKLPK